MANHSVTVCLWLCAALLPVSAQTYSFTTWAGHVPKGHDDGVGRAARFNEPRDVTSDSEGNLFVADTGNHIIRKITPDGVVSTIAGSPQQAGRADGSGTFARFAYPCAVTIDRAGNVYVADNGALRKITPAGLVTTLAGRAGEVGDIDGQGSAARFGFNSHPPSEGRGGLATDSAGNIYVADWLNAKIRKVTPDGVVTTFAGNSKGWRGGTDGRGDAATFELPRRLAVYANGNIVVADGEDRERMRTISADGEVTTLRASRGVYAFGIALDSAGNIFGTSDYGVIRISLAGDVTLFAGAYSYLSKATEYVESTERFFYPQGLTVDSSGSIFVADTGNHAIRKITADGVVTALAGNPPTDVDGTGTAARFNRPRGLAIDRDGNVFVSEAEAIRKITPAGVVTTLTSSLNRRTETWNNDSVAVDGAGNVFVLSENNNRTLHKVSPSGNVSTIALPESSTTLLKTIAADRSGNVYYASRDAISKLTPDGNVSVLAIGTFEELRLACGSRGEVYVANSSVIKKITPDGSITSVAAGTLRWPVFFGIGWSFQHISAIAVDNTDTIYVVDDAGFSRIKDGVVTTFTIRNESLRFSSIAVDHFGGIYVTDQESGTVSKGTPHFTEADARVVNVAVSATLRPQQPLMAGFVLRGAPRPVLLRAIGPGLRPFVTGLTLAGDPRLSIFNSSRTAIADNDNWNGDPKLTAAFAAAGAFPLVAGSADAALIESVSGPNTAHITSPTGGLTLFELFDPSPAAAEGIANVSARQTFGADSDDSITVGFTIEGGEKAMRIRALDPSRDPSSFSYDAAMSYPYLTVLDASGQLVAAGPAEGKPAQLLLTLQPGAYSAGLSRLGNAAGDAMIEINEVP